MLLSEGPLAVINSATEKTFFTAHCLGKLARVYTARKKYGKAESLLLRSMNIHGKIFPDRYLYMQPYIILAQKKLWQIAAQNTK